MAKIREKDRNAIMNALAGGVTPRQGIQHIQVGRKDEVAAILKDIEQVKAGGGAVRVISAGYGSGKAVPLDTKILTPNGWVKNGDLKQGDQVYTRNGDITTITGIFDQGDLDEYLMKLADGREIISADTHLWFVNTVDGNGTISEQVLTTRQIMESGTKNADVAYKFSIPYMPPIPFSEKELSIAPYDFGADCITSNENIPDDYMMSSIEQRQQILVGIFGEETSVKVHAKQQAKDCANIVRSLGRGCSITDADEGKYVLQLNDNAYGAEIVSVEATGKKQPMRCISVADESASYIIEDFILSHNTFLLTLVKTVALKQNMMVIETDLSPDRRLYSSSGQAQNLYRAEIRSLSTPLHPDGGALEELLDAIDEKVMSSDDNNEFFSEIRKMPYGFDAVTVCNKWHIANNPITEKEKRDTFILKDACLRWFSGESTAEGRKMLGVHQAVGDDGAWDALKLIAVLGHFAGYSGLFVELDECVNLYKINNSTSRDRNYEQILRIFNECLQGDAPYIGVIFSGTPEFLMDPRRGLFSYDALKSRLIGSEYATENSVDTSGPVIDLKPLTQEDLLVLLRNITVVEAMSDDEGNWRVDQSVMEAFLKRQYDTLGADYYKTPRELIRSWVMLLNLLRENPEMDAHQAVGAYEVKADKTESGLGAALSGAKSNSSMFDNDEDVDDEDFGDWD